MGTTDPTLRAFAAGVLRTITQTTPEVWKAAEQSGLVRPNRHGRELYSLTDAYRVAAWRELKLLGLNAATIKPLVPALLEVDWKLVGSGVALIAGDFLRLLLDVDALAREVDDALTHFGLSVAAEEPKAA